ncbi:MAG: HEPN domain-containing protein [Desulfococcaceae bacterium]
MINSKTLFDNFESNGFWWLPENPEKRISGKIFFDSKKEIRLDLLGAFQEITSFGRNEIYRPEIILGLTEDGKLCTLLTTTQIKSKFSFPGIITSLFSAKYLFIGIHFETKDSILFSSILVNYTYLEEWMNIKPIQTQYEFINDKFSKITSTYSYPTRFEIDVPCINAKICSDFGFNKREDFYRSINWNHTSFIKIIPNQIKDFEWFLDIVYSFQELLTLFIGEPVYQRDIKAIINIEDNNDKNKRIYIQIFFSQSERTIKDKIEPEDMITNLSFVAKYLPKIFENWFQKSSIFRPVCSLFFGTFFNKKTYIEFHFLGLMQAIESYHRTIENGKYVEEDKYQEYYNIILDSIPKEIPNDLKNSLKSRLKYGNEHSLRKRVKDTLKNLHEETIKTIFPNLKDFSNQIIDTRNYLTHYSEELREKALQSSELFYVTQRLTALITLLLLKQMGMPEQDIIQGIKTSKKFSLII